MLNSANSLQELDQVNMFIRALSDEMAQSTAHGDDARKTAIAIEMEEALFELRLRKLLICAFVDSGETDGNTTSH